MRRTLAALLVLVVVESSRAADPTPAPAAPSPATGLERPSAETTVGAPVGEAAYRAAVERSHAVWKARPGLGRVTEASCIEAWQEGDRARSILDEATPPPAKYAAYDAAVRKCIAASLATSDECLVRAGGGPKWRTQLRDARNLCLEVAPVVHRDRLGLPHRW